MAPIIGRDKRRSETGRAPNGRRGKRQNLVHVRFMRPGQILILFLLNHAVSNADVGLDILRVARISFYLFRSVAINTCREGVSEAVGLPQISLRI